MVHSFKLWTFVFFPYNRHFGRCIFVNDVAVFTCPLGHLKLSRSFRLDDVPSKLMQQFWGRVNRNAATSRIVVCVKSRSVISRDYWIQKVFLFISITLKKLAGTYSALPVVIFSQYSCHPFAHTVPNLNSSIKVLWMVVWGTTLQSSSRMIRRSLSTIRRSLSTIYSISRRELMFSCFSKPLVDIFETYTRLSIHFHQLSTNFNWLSTFCIQKLNNCANFAPAGRR